MPELRKFIRLTQNTYAVTIPSKYWRELKLTFGDYVEVSLIDTETIGIRKHIKPER